MTAIKWMVVVSLLLVSLYLASALILSVITAKSEKISCNGKVPIYVFTNGVHTDIAIPESYLSDSLYENLGIPTGTASVAFGWGDREFYLHTPEWSDLTLKTAFNALFLLENSAMHVTFYAVTNPEWIKIDLCPVQLNLLLAFIHQSFKKNGAGQYIPIKAPGYSLNDRFFEANGSFSLFRTCNVWTNEGLKKTRIRTSVWSPFDFGIIHQIKKSQQ